jgi:hypothetical protein
MDFGLLPKIVPDQVLQQQKLGSAPKFKNNSLCAVVLNHTARLL